MIYVVLCYSLAAVSTDNSGYMSDTCGALEWLSCYYIIVVLWYIQFVDCCHYTCTYFVSDLHVSCTDSGSNINLSTYDINLILSSYYNTLYTNTNVIELYLT